MAFTHLINLQNKTNNLQMYGGSAAQSTTLQVMDAALGIKHEGG